MWSKKAFVAKLKASLAETDQARAEDTARGDTAEGVVVTYHLERERRDALLWLAGKNVQRDFKVESRYSDGAWAHRLKYGSLGFSAAETLVEITTGGDTF